MKNEKNLQMETKRELPQTEMSFKPIEEVEGIGCELPDLEKRVLTDADQMHLALSGIVGNSPQKVRSDAPTFYNDYNSPYDIPVNQVYQITVGADNELWCRFTAPTGQKINITSKFSGNALYETYIYELDLDTLTLNPKYAVTNIFLDSDALSFASNGSIYYLRFKVLSGNHDLMFSLEAMAGAGLYEASNNYYMATQYKEYINVIEKIDNFYDWDWFRFVPETNDRYYVCVVHADDPNKQIPVTIGAVNPATATLSVNTLTTPIIGFSFSGTPGAVCGICVKPADFGHAQSLVGQSYRIIVGKRGSAPCPKKITLDKIEGGKVCNFMQYVEYWRMEGANKNEKCKFTATIASEDFDSYTAPVLFVDEYVHEKETSQVLAFPRTQQHTYEVDMLVGPGLDGIMSGYHYDKIVFGWYDFTGANIKCSQSYYISMANA